MRVERCLFSVPQLHRQCSRLLNEYIVQVNHQRAEGTEGWRGEEQTLYHDTGGANN